jgi:MoaA/NifB/PqqE/SkfB family radical SAM enzyme
LAKKEFMDIGVFEKDMIRMAELFDNNDIQNIRLLGGEPLLHPRVKDFMVIAGNYFPKIRRELVTNGLLLSAMSDSFWKTCQTTNTWVNITYYPVPFDLDEVGRKARTKKVKIIINPMQYFNGFRKDVYDLTGAQDEYLSHSNCQLFGYCCQLNNGKFYPCSISAYFHHFNRYFDLGLSLSEGNYIDIYKAQSKVEFYKLITTPIPCCKYCNMNARRFGVKWERSKQSMDEWT